METQGWRATLIRSPFCSVLTATGTQGIIQQSFSKGTQQASDTVGTSLVEIR